MAPDNITSDTALPNEDGGEATGDIKTPNTNCQYDAYSVKRCG
jgi:hypothetical protein